MIILYIIATGKLLVFIFTNNGVYHLPTTHTILIHSEFKTLLNFIFKFWRVKSILKIISISFIFKNISLTAIVSLAL